MARAMWSGSLSFGLVNVPVGLYSATEDKTVHFHQLQKGTASRVRNKRVNEDTGEEVAYEDVVKGYDLGDGQYVIVSPEELESVEPGPSKTIDIVDFVDQDEIDPLYYQRTYYLGPTNKAAAKPYALLARAMSDANRVAIATFVMRAKQYLAAVRAVGNVLVLETMFFADEVRDPTETVPDLPAAAEAGGRELDMALSLLESMTAPWDPSNYEDTYRDRVMSLIEAKQQGEEVTAQAQPASAKVVDLVEALERSLRAASEEKERHGAKSRSGGESPSREAATETPTPSGSKGADSLESSSKEELYKRAKELGVEGRSKMTHDELVAALRGAKRRSPAA